MHCSYSWVRLGRSYRGPGRRPGRRQGMSAFGFQVPLSALHTTLNLSISFFFFYISLDNVEDKWYINRQSCLLEETVEGLGRHELSFCCCLSCCLRLELRPIYPHCCSIHQSSIYLQCLLPQTVVKWHPIY